MPLVPRQFLGGIQDRLNIPAGDFPVVAGASLCCHVGTSTGYPFPTSGIPATSIRSSAAHGSRLGAGRVRSRCAPWQPPR